MDADVSDEDMREAAFADEKVKSYLAGKEPRKVFVVPKKLVNIVV
jgi:leucyl-tRNA synthetase